jgi:hypothetical protein
MSTNQELYKQAILDAKAVRESALANAKSVLSETFEPRIKEMMRLKLSEELDEMEETEETLDNIVDTDTEEVKTSNMEESTLDDILAELDAIENEGKESTEEPETMNEEAGEAEEETEEEESSEEEVMGDEGEEEEVQDDTEVVDITVGEFKEIIRDLFNTLQGGGVGMEDMQDTADAEMQAGEDDEISLEEIIAQLEGEDNAEEDEMLNPIEEAKKSMKKDEKKKDEEKKEKEEMAKELKEAIKTIQSLKSELNEINLLNAKLLYVNKLFKSKSLNESQKVKVLNAFDRATTVKEAENTYKTLNESLSLTKKSTIKESVGFASKPMGNAPAKPIVEHDASVSRWQHLAGIK